MKSLQLSAILSLIFSTACGAAAAPGSAAGSVAISDAALAAGASGTNISVSGSFAATSFVARDAVYASRGTNEPTQEILVVLSDQAGLCDRLLTTYGNPNDALVLVSFHNTDGNVAIMPGTFPLTAGTGAPAGGTQATVWAYPDGTGAQTLFTTGQVQLETTGVTNNDNTVPLTIQAGNAGNDQVTGTATAAFCKPLFEMLAGWPETPR